MDSALQTKLKVGLLFNRLTIFLVFLMWTLDKIFNPEHGVRVFEHFYRIAVTTEMIVAIGWVQLIFVVVFGLGLWKTWTYLAVLAFHLVSTISAFSLYLDPFNNLLFFAAWPMLAACYVLYTLRQFDTLDGYLFLKYGQ